MTYVYRHLVVQYTNPLSKYIFRDVSDGSTLDIILSFPLHTNWKRKYLYFRFMMSLFLLPDPSPGPTPPLFFPKYLLHRDLYPELSTHLKLLPTLTNFLLSSKVLFKVYGLLTPYLFVWKPIIVWSIDTLVVFVGFFLYKHLIEVLCILVQTCNFSNPPVSRTTYRCYKLSHSNEFKVLKFFSCCDIFPLTIQFECP